MREFNTVEMIMNKYLTAVCLAILHLFPFQTFAKISDIPHEVAIETTVPTLPQDFSEHWILSAEQTCALSPVKEFKRTTFLRANPDDSLTSLTRTYVGGKLILHGILEHRNDGTPEQGVLYELIGGKWFLTVVQGERETREFLKKEMKAWSPTDEEMRHCNRTSKTFSL